MAVFTIGPIVSYWAWGQWQPLPSSLLLCFHISHVVPCSMFRVHFHMYTGQYSKGGGHAWSWFANCQYTRKEVTRLHLFLCIFFFNFGDANNDHLAWFPTSASSTEDEMGKEKPTSLFRNNCFHCGLCPAATFSNTLSTYQKIWIWDQGRSYPVLGPLSENVLRLSSTSLFSFQSLELSTVSEGFYSKLRALRTFKYFHLAAVSRLQVC